MLAPQDIKEKQKNIQNAKALWGSGEEKFQAQDGRAIIWCAVLAVSWPFVNCFQTLAGPGGAAVALA